MRLQALILSLFVGLMGGAVAHAASERDEPTTFEAEIVAAKSAMMADPEVALRHATTAYDLALTVSEAERPIAQATAGWLRGEALNRLNKPQEASPVIEQALTLVLAHAPNSKLHGDLLMTRAAIAGTSGKLQLALQTLHEAYNIFQTVGAARSQAIALQNIGSIYSDAGDYERVIDYYDQSADVYGDDPALNISGHNNRGKAYKELGRFAEAESEFQQALVLARKQQSVLLEVRIMTNIASAQYLGGNLDGADATALAALALATTEATAGWAPFLHGVRAQVALARGDLDAAKTLIDIAFAGADLDATTMPFRDFHEAAYQIFDRRGESQKALRHLEAFKRLDDEARALIASAANALMTAQFDSANQKLKISELKKSQLQNEAELSTSRAEYRAAVLYSAVAIMGLLVAASLFGFVSIRRSRNKTEVLNAQLNVANGALEKALRARTEFLAMTSHEVRTPLNGILGMTQVMLADERVSGDLRSNIALVHGAGETMKALVDDILDVAKMETGKLTIDTRVFDLKAMLIDVGALWQGSGAKNGLEITVDVTNCPDKVMGDEQRLRQVVFNLMSNATKFTEKGYVALSAYAENMDGAQMLRMTIADTGIGIPATHLERIFESFQQVDRGTSRRYGGTGLGLAICRNLVRAMGGELTVESEIGRGSTFTVVMPLKDCTETAEAHTYTAEGCDAKSVLLAHKNLLTQSILSAQLAVDGFAVNTVDDAAGALTLAQSRPFAFVVLDAQTMKLSDLQGLEHLTMLRNFQKSATVFVMGDTDQRQAILRCGADQIVSPVMPARELSAALTFVSGEASAPVADISLDTDGVMAA